MSGSGDSGAPARAAEQRQRYVLDGRAEERVETMAEIEACLRRGAARKRMAATAMNERSSRAHALFILSLSQSAGGVERTTRLFLADLGGSEKLGKSGAADGFKSLVVTSGGEEVSRISWADYYRHRARLQESRNANVSSLSLP